MKNEYPVLMIYNTNKSNTTAKKNKIQSFTCVSKTFLWECQVFIEIWNWLTVLKDSCEHMSDTILSKWIGFSAIVNIIIIDFCKSTGTRCHDIPYIDASTLSNAIVTFSPKWHIQNKNGSTVNISDTDVKNSSELYFTAHWTFFFCWKEKLMHFLYQKSFVCVGIFD